jgi:hypothetical protein
LTSTTWCRTIGSRARGQRRTRSYWQIEANDGIFELLLVEPRPELPGKFRIIDGERRRKPTRF